MPSRIPNQKEEKFAAIVLANKILDRVNADPDDDLAILARQFLRAIEWNEVDCLHKPGNS